MILDEIQQAPGVLDRLKAVIDQDGGSGRYWLTGSQSFPAMRGVSESLAGRVGIVELAGFSRLAAARVGGLLNAAELARDAGVVPSTAGAG